MNIYTDIGHFVCTTYQRNLQSMGRPDKRKAARDSQFVGKKKESHEINQLRGQWALPENCSYLNSTRAHFIINRIGLRNTNRIRAYITITIKMTLMKRATKVAVTLILRKTVILIAKVTRAAKII